MKWPRNASGLFSKALRFSRISGIVLLLLAISSLPLYGKAGTGDTSTTPGEVQQAKDAVSPSPAAAPVASEISKLEVTSGDNSVNIKILANGQVPSYRVIPQGTNFLLEIPGVSIEDNVANIPVNSPLVESIQVDAAGKGAVKLNINVLKSANYNIASTSNGLEMTIEPSAIQKVAGVKKSKIKGIGFQMLPDGRSDIHMEITGNPPVEVRKIGDKELVLALDKTYLPEKFRRYLDTSQFISAVDKIIPEKDPTSANKALIKIALRDDVPYWVESKEGELEIKFAPSQVPPEKPIKLSEPTTLVQGTKEEVVPVAKPQPQAAPETNMAAAVPPTELLPPTPEETGLFPESSLATIEQPGADVLGIKKEYTGEPISLDLQDANLVNVLRLIA
ncbi:MAG TPA: hypothetical protein ENG51_07435, partial [Deltaproteobacteria bacterium]|nr:hypothetical protein [Deltaproteobacteria bacterium]